MEFAFVVRGLFLPEEMIDGVGGGSCESLGCGGWRGFCGGAIWLGD